MKYFVHEIFMVYGMSIEIGMEANLRSFVSLIQLYTHCYHINNMIFLPC